MDVFDIKDEDKAAFINDLKALYDKYGLIIKGCGYCGSPWLEKGKPWHYELNKTDIRWVEDAHV